MDVAQALDLKLNNKLSYAQIGQLLNVPKSTVHYKLQHLVASEYTDDYCKGRADILAQTQLRLLSELDDAKLKDMSGRDIAVSFGIMYDKERLERGQSTQNIDVRSVLLEVKLERQALENALGLSDNVGDNRATKDIKELGNE